MTEAFARQVGGTGARGGSNPWLGRDFWGVLAWGPPFFGEVFFRPMQVFDPSQERMREVIRRFRRFYDRAAVAGNPAVEQFRSVVGFFEGAAGALLGTALERVIRVTSGVDLGFVRAASSTRLYGAGGGPG